ncbi:PTS system N-acetylglucosamine-specific IIC component [Spiroplasma clarkii]|uniref:PTS system, N-acetylglucosamine-specific IIB component n=1 Tax=Spiroplasma clarkii TaxID=2139 RepID=A0A1Y0KZ14_9MOLU|nr:PTS transporter subunit EIIC [Spiroplasma clarkii]ARU90967.1 PTS system N-acetylglucosamine-specific IIC component [Spiroplasma clarkii]ATX70408.1 PTS system, N-acetylglucosamine-specific IIB component [Spiroplasma clarkii]
MDKILEKKAAVKQPKKEKISTPGSNGWKRFWSNTLAKLQGLGKSLMYPIALLPFAALLNRFGSLGIELNSTEEALHNVGWWFGFIIQKPGGTIFDQLPLIFAIGTAFGLAKDQRGEAGLVGAAFYLILTAFLVENGLPSLFYKTVLQFDVHDKVTGEVSGGLSQLFYVPNYGIIDGKLTKIGGTYILNIGVLGGIVAGCLSAWSYNKFRETKLPQALSFFGGRRFVPMIVMVLSIPVAFIFAIIWPWFQYGLVSFGNKISSGDAWAIPGAFLYAFINRLVQPTGLHHIINTFLWFQLPISGHIVDFSGKVIMFSDVAPAGVPNETALAALSSLFNVTINESNFKDYIVVRAGALPTGAISVGDGTYTIFGDINAFQKSMISGNFQTGYFPMFWGGLPGAALAMIFSAKKEKRKEVATFLGGVAVVAALTGIDEPLIFAFIFVGPILWVMNAFFTSVFAAIAVAMQMRVGFGFSGGFIDYIISFASSWGMSSYTGMARGGVYGVLSNPLWMFALAGLAFPTYFFSFKFVIKKMDIKTPGREDDGEEVAVSKVAPKKGDGNKYQTMAEGLVKIIGMENIVKVDNCATRLRLTVKDNQTNIDDKDIKALGAYGVKRLGEQGLQIIIGTDVEHVANAVHNLTGK